MVFRLKDLRQIQFDKEIVKVYGNTEEKKNYRARVSM